MKDEALCRYFSSPAWRRQLKQLQKKSFAGYSDGWVYLQDASPEECQAAEGVLGRHFTTPCLRYRVSDFARALRSGRFAVESMGDFWLRLNGQPLIPHPAQKSARQDMIRDFFLAEGSVPHGSAASGWLCALRQSKGNGYQLLLPHIGKEPAAAQWLHWVCCALDRLQQSEALEELALCSYAVSTDPHALDLEQPAGRLLLSALAYWKECPVPGSARDRLALYRQCGLLLDDLSCFTVQRGLILMGKDGQEHPTLAQFRQSDSFCLLTSSQLMELSGAVSPTGRAYLLENQMVFSTLCRCRGILHPVLCTSGQLREASWQLLDLLSASNCQLYYAGDFDPEGLAIADRLWQKYGDLLHPWHMTLEDYHIALSQKPIASSRIQQLDNIRCPELQPVGHAIAQEQKAGYQEALVGRYLADLQCADG